MKSSSFLFDTPSAERVSSYPRGYIVQYSPRDLTCNSVTELESNRYLSAEGMLVKASQELLDLRDELKDQNISTNLTFNTQLDWKAVFGKWRRYRLSWPWYLYLLLLLFFECVWPIAWASC